MQDATAPQTDDRRARANALRLAAAQALAGANATVVFATAAIIGSTLAADPALATQQQRVAERARVLPVVAAALLRYGKAELMARCEALGLPFAPIAQPWDLFEDPHLHQSGGLLPLTLPDGRVMPMPAYPLALDGERLPLRRDLPSVGEHNAEVLEEIGWPAAAEAC